MNRQLCLALYLAGSVLASASDTESRRVDALLQEQEQNKSRKLPPAQSFVLGNTELRLDNSAGSPARPVVQPVSEPSQAAVTLRQPLNENASLNFRNEFGSQKSEGLPFSSNENSYQLNRKEIWSLDWTRSTWNGKAYTEAQSSGDNEQQLLSSQQSARGLQTGTQLPSGTGLSVEMRQENNPGTTGAVFERNIYQTQLSQKVGNLPFTLEFKPAFENESGIGGNLSSRSTRFDNSLRWQATPQTQIVLGSGVNSKDYFDATRENALLYYSQFDTTLKKDLTFSLRSDFQDLTRNSAGLPSYQEQRMNIQIGPRLRLPENFTASLDMRYGFSQQNGSTTGGESEQALALSIQGRF